MKLSEDLFPKYSSSPNLFLSFGNALQHLTLCYAYNYKDIPGCEKMSFIERFYWKNCLVGFAEINDENDLDILVKKWSKERFRKEYYEMGMNHIKVRMFFHSNSVHKKIKAIKCSKHSNNFIIKLMVGLNNIIPKLANYHFSSWICLFYYIPSMICIFATNRIFHNKIIFLGKNANERISDKHFTVKVFRNSHKYLWLTSSNQNEKPKWWITLQKRLAGLFKSFPYILMSIEENIKFKVEHDFSKLAKSKGSEDKMMPTSYLSILNDFLKSSFELESTDLRATYIKHFFYLLYRKCGEEYSQIPSYKNQYLFDCIEYAESDCDNFNLYLLNMFIQCNYYLKTFRNNSNGLGHKSIADLFFNSPGEQQVFYYQNDPKFHTSALIKIFNHIDYDYPRYDLIEILLNHFNFSNTDPNEVYVEYLETISSLKGKDLQNDSFHDENLALHFKDNFILLLPDIGSTLFKKTDLPYKLPSVYKWLWNWLINKREDNSIPDNLSSYEESLLQYLNNGYCNNYKSMSIIKHACKLRVKPFLVVCLITKKFIDDDNNVAPLDYFFLNQQSIYEEYKILYSPYDYPSLSQFLFPNTYNNAVELLQNYCESSHKYPDLDIYQKRVLFSIYRYVVASDSNKNEIKLHNFFVERFIKPPLRRLHKKELDRSEKRCLNLFISIKQAGEKHYIDNTLVSDTNHIIEKKCLKDETNIRGNIEEILYEPVDEDDICLKEDMKLVAHLLCLKKNDKPPLNMRLLTEKYRVILKKMTDEDFKQSKALKCYGNIDSARINLL